MSTVDELFRQDAYLQTCTARITQVQRLADGALAIELDRTVFYPLGGGQAGDAGWLMLPSGEQIAVVDTRKAKDASGAFTGQIGHVLGLSPAQSLDSLLSILEHTKQQGDEVTAQIDWPRRHRLMRFHTATHLLCHIVPQLVNGCSITPDYARLDFNMTEPLDKDALTASIAQLVQAAHSVTVSSISDEELDANPGLVKSMSVSPPRGLGSVRVIRIGDAQKLIDLQPCGGTHVQNTAEIGAVIVTKIEKKSATTRRVVLGFA
jgi:misacylated tRNA(Ala) deacylase